MLIGAYCYRWNCSVHEVRKNGGGNNSFQQVFFYIKDTNIWVSCFQNLPITFAHLHSFVYPISLRVLYHVHNAWIAFQLQVSLILFATVADKMSKGNTVYYCYKETLLREKYKTSKWHSLYWASSWYPNSSAALPIYG